MKSLNISKVLVSKRREKGITQDEIASYIGVSKASVSKWETGQSYPDITLLPELATFFNLSIDELIGYEKQMTKEDIKKNYDNFARRFAKEDFLNVYSDVRNLIKKYYSCFPLLMQMCNLLLNHYNLAEKSKQEEVVEQIITLCTRIKEESHDADLMKQSDFIKSFIYLQKGEPHKTLDILGEECEMIFDKSHLISNAFMMIGNKNKAEEILQASMYQDLMGLMSQVVPFLNININNMDKVNEILTRALEISKIYNIDKLNPNTMAVIYIYAASIYADKNKEQALKYLRMYVKTAPNLFPLVLHGDDYFDKLDNWIKEFPLGNMAPTNEETVKNNLISSLEKNPAFASLKEEKDFKEIVKELKIEIERWR